MCYVIVAMDKLHKSSDIMVLRRQIINELFDYFEYSEAY